jgi:AcrR family transcriptional regulator
MNEGNSKERVLSATIGLLQKKAMDEITIREIAVLAGVNVASINYYFGSKEILFTEALEKITIQGHDEWVKDNIDLGHCKKNDLLNYVTFLYSSSVQHKSFAKTRILNLLYSEDINRTNMKIYETLYAIVKGLKMQGTEAQLKVKVSLIFSSIANLACSTKEINAFMGASMEDETKLTQYVKSLLRILFP